MRIKKIGLTVCFVCLLFSKLAVAQRNSTDGRAPSGNGQLLEKPTLFEAGKDQDGRIYFLNGQDEKNGKLVLSASNGFFDPKTCKAAGVSLVPKGPDKKLIPANFAFLERWNKTGQPLRWYFWVSKPGTIRANIHLAVNKKQAGAKLRFRCAGISKHVVTKVSDRKNVQKWNLQFEVKTKGQHVLEVEAVKLADRKTGVGKLYYIDLFGPGIEDAKLLRARWRPLAVHSGYRSSKCNNSKLWVMETRSTSDSGSYSPITTPFGYFGTSFDADRKSTGSFNFSMWAGNRKSGVPPLDQMPFLIAAGSPKATFSGFGHEGSGVKIRDWTALPNKPKTVIQALRVTSDNKYNTFYGYLWDHQKKRWFLYASGKARLKRNKPIKNLIPGSFCEVPGPPAIQRTGDVIREVRRKGWCFGADKKWYRLDQPTFRPKEISNKYWTTSSDGEFVMGTGGLRYYKSERETKTLFKAEKLPEYLKKSVVSQLWKLPVDINEQSASKISKNSAKVKIRITTVGTHSKAILYFGEKDCLSFTKRKLHATEKKSAISQSTQTKGRYWENKVSLSKVRKGVNYFHLKNLKPGTTYYCRLFVECDQGQVWSHDSLQFKTK